MSKALYVHIPFCQSICSYCDFCRFGYDQDLADRYLKALNKELIEKVENKDLKTIYIGGGTPTALNLDQLRFLLTCLKNYALNVEEYTIEINPETMTSAKFKLLAEFGINRVSIGVQTLNERLLKYLNRKHDIDSVFKCIDYFNQIGISNISVDLIYGLPNQTIKDWQETVNGIVKANIKHVSLYNLTIEKNALFGRKNIKKLDEEICDEMYFWAIKTLESEGFHQYEISNFAKIGYLSQHNLAYWQYQDFYGIGVSAAGKERNYRYTNTSNINDYLHGVLSIEEIELKPKDYLFEKMMMGLRIKDGILLNDDEFNSIIEMYRQSVDDLLKKGLIEFDNNKLKATDKGYYIINDILVDLLP